MSDVLARLDRLERENRRLRMVAGGAMALSVLTVANSAPSPGPPLASAQSAQRIIEAEAFHVVDRYGVLQASIGTTVNVDGQVGSALWMGGSDGKTSVYLFSGIAQGPSMQLVGAIEGPDGNRPWVAFGVRPDGSAHVQVRDEFGRTRWLAGAP